MFYAKDNEPNPEPQGFFGGMGQKVKEAGSFFQSLAPENAEALLVAGLTLVGNNGNNAGQAGLAGLSARNNSIGRKQQQEQRGIVNGLRGRQLSATEGNLAATNESNRIRNESLKQRVAASKIPKTDPFDDRIDAAVREGLFSKEVGDSLRIKDLNAEATRSSKVTTHNGDLTKANITSRNDELSRIKNVSNLVGNLAKSVEDSSPFDFGAVGNIREAAGGVFGQVGLEGLEESIAPDGSMRQEARTVGLMAATSIINESRATGEERAQVVKIMGVLENSSSRTQSLKGLKEIQKISKSIEERVQSELNNNSTGGGRNFDAESLYQGYLKDPQ